MVSAARVLVAVAIVACVLAPISSGGAKFTERRVIFITMTGSGKVVSTPVGIACPGKCRSNGFHKDETVRLVAKPAPGWTFGHWGSAWCTAVKAMCTIALVDTHDCAGGGCPLAAFGVRVTFVRAKGST